MSNENNAQARFAKILILSILLIITVIFANQDLRAPFQDNLKLQDVLGALGALFIIVLLVERVIEIIVSIWREPRAEQLRQDVEATKEKNKNGTIPAERTKAEKELAKYKSDTQGYALLVAFSLSIIICSAGVGLLSEILTMPSGDASNTQRSFIRGIDIVLTSGLIAGGSEAFHHFVNSLVTFFKKTKENMEQGTPTT